MPLRCLADKTFGIDVRAVDVAGERDSRAALTGASRAEDGLGWLTALGR
jgi:hypothetical protein